MRDIKKAYKYNIILFILELVALIWMMSGIRIFSNSNLLMASKLEMFKFFTIDSNFLMGIIALLAAIEEKKSIK